MNIGVIKLVSGRRRYSLIVKNLDNGNEYLIKIKERDENGQLSFKDKTFLTTIDKRTTDFENKTHFLQYLNSKGYIDFTNADVYITYKSEGKTKTLDVIYDDQILLKEFSTKYTSSIALSDRKFQSIFNDKFMKEIKKGTFYRFMLDNKYINNRLKYLLEDYLYENREFRINDIMKEFSRYKSFRDYILGRQQYEKTQFRHRNRVKTINNEEQGELEELKIKINSNDDFLNSLRDRDEISELYDLEDLERILEHSEDETPLFDGLAKVKKL